jgi:hypothetical protein
VDLNPIRAGVARPPEDSEFTSVRARIRALAAPAQAQQIPLLPFCTPTPVTMPAVPFPLTDYLNLVDWSGRIVRGDGSRAMEADLPPILRRLSVDVEAWRNVMQLHGNRFGRALGQLEHLRRHARALGQCWIRGLSLAQRLYRMT